MDLLQLNNFPKISRRRRESVSKAVHDIEDLFTAITFLDENQVIGKLSTFVATSPDKMPSVRLVEGDLEIVWKKLSTMDENLLESCSNSKNCAANIKQTNDNVLEIVRQVHSIQQSIQANLQVGQYSQPMANYSMVSNRSSAMSVINVTDEGASRGRDGSRKQGTGVTGKGG